MLSDKSTSADRQHLVPPTKNLETTEEVFEVINIHSIQIGNIKNH